MFDVGIRSEPRRRSHGRLAPHLRHDAVDLGSEAGGVGFAFKRPVPLERAHLQSQEPSDPVVPGLE